MRLDEVHSARDVMTAVVTTGTGGYDKLVLSEVPRPVPGPGEVLVRVSAAGMNNTEINTRVGWYQDGGWNETTTFPSGQIRPLLAGSFPLEQIAAAQQRFLEKGHVGKFVLVAPVVLEAQN